MANENQNTGPNTQGNQQAPKKSIIDAKAALRELIEDQGDYNNLLKSSLRDLDNMQKAYVKISARLDALNKGAVNVKQVQQELAKLNEKEYIAKQKVLDLEAGLSEETKRQQRYAETLNQLFSRAQTEKQRERIQKQIDLNNAKLEGNLELKNLEYARVGARIAEEEKISGQASLETEKKVSKQLGISGNLMKLFADKVGVGQEAFEAMSFESRKLVASTGQVGGFGSKLKVLQAGLKAGAGAIKESFTDPIARGAMVVAAYKAVSAGLTMAGNAAASAGNFLAGMSEDSSNIIRGLTGGISDLARKIPLVGGLIGGLIDGFSAILDLLIGVDDKIVKAGRQLNMTAGEARSFNRSLQDAAFNSNNIYVTSKKLLESQVDLTQQLGTVNLLSREILETNIALKEFAGLEEGTRARIAELAIVTEKSSQGTVKGILAQVAGLKKATGIEFQSQQILKDISSQSGVIALQFSKYPKEMTKTLLTVKAMGLELKDLDSIADSFLDFESSISKEFEAQLLTGKQINLAKAREAFLNNDLATAASEITRQVGSTEDFLKLNRIQAESLAASFGMSRDQLGEMLRKQEILAKVGGKQGDTAKEQLRLGLERYKNQEALSEAIGRENYQALVNMSVQEKIASFIEKIKQSIVDFVERTNIISKIENFVNMLQNPDTMRGILGKIRDTISSFIAIVGELLADIIEVGGEVANFFTFGKKGDVREAKAYELGAKIRAGSLSMSESVRSVGGETVSVQDNAAKKEAGLRNEVAAAAQNSMVGRAMPLVVETTLKGPFLITDTIRQMTTRTSTQTQLDNQTGKGGKK